MAYNYPGNPQALKDIHWHGTSGEGREYNGRYLLSELEFPNAWGDHFPILTIINGIERRQAENNAAISALVSTIGKLAGGESFDRDALIAEVEAAAERGAGRAIDSITVTVKGE